MLLRLLWLWELVLPSWMGQQPVSELLLFPVVWQPWQLLPVEPQKLVSLLWPQLIPQSLSLALPTAFRRELGPTSGHGAFLRSCQSWSQLKEAVCSNGQAVYPGRVGLGHVDGGVGRGSLPAHEGSEHD